MLPFILAVLFTISLYLLMRAFPKYGINPFQAVVFNYYACLATGLVLMPDRSALAMVDWTATPTLITIALGTMFVIVFLLIGQTATKSGVTTATLSSDLSLVIPVVFGLFVFKNTNKDFTVWNYLGIVLAVVAVAMSAIKRRQTGPSVRSGVGNQKMSGAAWFFPVLLFLASGTNNTLINYLSSQFYKPDQMTLFMIIACIGAIIVGTSLLIYRILITNEVVTLKNVLGGLLLGVPNFLSLYFLLKALAAFGNSAAFVFPIYNVMTIIASSFAAWLLFKERLETVNKIGLVLAIIAIVLISYQEILSSF
jgi:drug/metabolite transporter (DMT)-like permease